MLKNYIITSFRNLRKNKLVSLINIIGLAIGMTTCLLIMYYVRYERSYDNFNQNNDRIYRLRYERTDENGEAVRFASCCPPAGLRLRSKYPEVEKAGRIFRFMASVSHDNNKFIEERMYFAEPDFLEILKFQFLKGDPVNGLKEPNRAFISRSTAIKYFGEIDPIGQTISVDKKTDYQVSGVFEDIPQNSHLKFDILLSYQNLISMFGKDVEDSWGDTGWFTYVLLKEGADKQLLENKFPALVESEFGGVLREYRLKLELKLQPLNDIHLTSHYMQEYEPNGNKDIVDFLSIIAVFIIVIAWVNYVNLSTAHSLRRAKEVGLRKVVGASRFQLVLQFFSETIIINLASIILTFLIILVLIPYYRNLTGVSTEFQIWSQLWFWSDILAMFCAGIFLSGLYPILVLSGFNPIAALKGKIGNSAKGINLRKGLALFQFFIAFCLITGTVAVFSQLSFMRSQDPGFSMDRKIIIRAPRVREASFSSKLQTFKEQLLKNSNIDKFCVVTEVPGKQVLWDAGGISRAGSDESKNYQIVGIDYDFVDVYNLKMLYGRNFSKNFPSDSSALILNETAVKWMGFKSNDVAIGQQVDYWRKIYTVVGVMKNYHQQSLKAAFEPHIFRLMPEGRGIRGVFTVVFNNWNAGSSIDEIKKLYENFFPDNPFEYFYLDEYYERQYKSDNQFGKIFGIFSFLAIFITGLGILGLSSFMVVQRRKEVAIRKVLGAGIYRLLFLLIKDFIILIMFSFIIALPASYLGINYWLDSFAAKMDITILLFIIPLGIVTVITGLTISTYILKAASVNPVDVIRYE